MVRRRKRKNNLKPVFLILAIGAIVFCAYLFQDEIKKFFTTGEGTKSMTLEGYKSNLKNYSVFGIDVSQYQADIDWQTLTNKQKIDFVFIRATAGINHLDRKFIKNWSGAKQSNIIRGAYHYYRPDENSTEQAKFFIKNVVLEQGDFPPVLDIEKYSRVQSLTSLKNGLLNWLRIVEEHYGVTPILYSYNKFYVGALADDKRFEKYPVWIAWYNLQANPSSVIKSWVFWQFTDKGQFEGITGDVDVNVFNGKKHELDGLRIKN
jgi:lysozyme